VRTPGLAPARPRDLIQAAKASARATAREVADVLGDRRGSALGVLHDLMATLGLPGSDLLSGDDPAGGVLVEPAERSVAAFDRLARDEAQHRAEMEEI
jgi:hypothetical protein